MTRRTSIDVYNKIKEDGLLSKLRFEVYEILFKYGPLTQMELCKKTNGVRQDRTYMPRFAELKNMGVLEDIGTKECSITGREVLLWDVTNRLPVKFEKPQRIKCKNCNGNGYHEESQGKLL